jgi:hypothetical protein
MLSIMHIVSDLNLQYAYCGGAAKLAVVQAPVVEDARVQAPVVEEARVQAVESAKNLSNIVHLDQHPMFIDSDTIQSLWGARDALLSR